MSMSYFTFHKLSKHEQANYLHRLRQRESNLLERIVQLRMEADAARAELHALEPPVARPLMHDPALDAVRVLPPRTEHRRTTTPKVVFRTIGDQP